MVPVNGGTLSNILCGIAGWVYDMSVMAER